MRPRPPSVVLAAALAAVLVLPGGVALAGGKGHVGGGGKGSTAAAADKADRPAAPRAAAGDEAPRKPGRRARSVPFSLGGVLVSADTSSITVGVRHGSASVRGLRGRTVVLRVAAGTKVVRNGRRASAAALTKGDRVTVVGVRTGAALAPRLVAASGRRTARPVAPTPDTVQPRPDTP